MILKTEEYDDYWYRYINSIMRFGIDSGFYARVSSDAQEVLVYTK